jgi:hypothetical protein
VRWVIEREAGTYRVQHLAVVDNPTLKVIAPDPDGPPALRVALIPGYGEVRIRTGHAPRSTEVHNGTLELRGPFTPGSTSYPFTYDIGGPGESLQTDLVLANSVESVELRVRDFGVWVDPGRLHPARPVSEKDQIYLRFVGFDERAGTVIPIALDPIPPREPLPRPLQALMVAALAGGLLLFVARPAAPGGEGASTLDSVGAEEHEKEALFSALRDLEDDYETGKLSAQDRERLRTELRTDALRALARERRATEPVPEAGAAPEHCTCGRIPHADDRFCAACGKAL